MREKMHKTQDDISIQWKLSQSVSAINCIQCRCKNRPEVPHTYIFVTLIPKFEYVIDSLTVGDFVANGYNHAFS